MKDQQSASLFAGARRELTEKQARRIDALVRGYENRNAHNGVTEVYIENLLVNATFAHVVIRTRRTDCDPYSPRAVVCAEGGCFFVGQKGGTKMVSTYRLGQSARDHSDAAMARELKSILWDSRNERVVAKETAS
jgi:hypothetical protein